MIASHLIFGAYGHWLPNDPRGSWSDYVRNVTLLPFGEATKVETRTSLANNPHDVDCRQEGKKSLRFPAVHFTGLQARAIGRGFAKAISDSGYQMYACAIMPTHVHVVVAEHSNIPKQIIGHLKGRATHHLKLENLHPLNNAESPWSQKGWAVFLNDNESVLKAIEYVNANPIHEGLPKQTWWFVQTYPC